MEMRKERTEVVLCGGKPWGFSIKGGTENNKNITVSKLEPGGKGEASGLNISDVIICVNDVHLAGMRRAQAVELIRKSGDRLVLSVQRSFPINSVDMPKKVQSPEYDLYNSETRIQPATQTKGRSAAEQKNWLNSDSAVSRPPGNDNANNQQPAGYVFSTNSDKAPKYQDIKDTIRSVVINPKRDALSGNQQDITRDRLSDKGRRSAPSSGVPQASESPGNHQPPVAIRHRHGNNRDSERPRSWHASKHPEIEQAMPSSAEKVQVPPFARRKSREWLESEDLRSTLDRKSRESLLSASSSEHLSLSVTSNGTSGSANAYNARDRTSIHSNPSLMEAVEALARSRPGSMDYDTAHSRSSQDSLDSMSQKSNCPHSDSRANIRTDLGNCRLRASGRYGEIWNLPQAHERARSCEGLLDTPRLRDEGKMGVSGRKSMGSSHTELQSRKGAGQSKSPSPPKGTSDQGRFFFHGEKGRHVDALRSNFEKGRPAGHVYLNHNETSNNNNNNAPSDHAGEGRSILKRLQSQQSSSVLKPHDAAKIADRPTSPTVSAAKSKRTDDARGILKRAGDKHSPTSSSVKPQKNGDAKQGEAPASSREAHAISKRIDAPTQPGECKGLSGQLLPRLGPLSPKFCPMEKPERLETAKVAEGPDSPKSKPNSAVKESSQPTSPVGPNFQANSGSGQLDLYAGNNPDFATLPSRTDEYKKNIKGMSKKVLKKTSFTRKDLELSPPYPNSVHRLAFRYPGIPEKQGDTHLPVLGMGSVRSKSTSSLLGSNHHPSTSSIPATLEEGKDELAVRLSPVLPVCHVSISEKLEEPVSALASEEWLRKSPESKRYSAGKDPEPPQTQEPHCANTYRGDPPPPDIINHTNVVVKSTPPAAPQSKTVPPAIAVSQGSSSKPSVTSPTITVTPILPKLPIASIFSSSQLFPMHSAISGVSDSGTSTLPPNSEYFKISASKAMLLSRMQEKVGGGLIDDLNDHDETDDERNIKKIEVLKRLTVTLNGLHKCKENVKSELDENEQLGKTVTRNVEELCTARELERFKTFVEEIDKIVNLIFSISGRLLRVENTLGMLAEDADPDEKNGLLEKRKKLSSQLAEADSLKENVNKRQETVCKTLSTYMDRDQYGLFEYYIKMKTDLISEQREIDDKMKLGEEQMREIYDSLPGPVQDKHPQYQAFTPDARDGADKRRPAQPVK